MINIIRNILILICSVILMSCTEKNESIQITAQDILGNPEYLAISYSGYRENSRNIQPTNRQLKEDLEIMHAMGIRIFRTYNTHFDQTANVLQAIKELKLQDPEFEMYVMLGAWINCENAFTWTDEIQPNHEKEDYEANKAEIERAVKLAQAYPEIVKIIAVGNEAMVHWATTYFVKPKVILNWVNHLQELKQVGELDPDLWITSSDNFASWGGGGPEYHNEDLKALIKAVDYISMHTYPMHDTHYNGDFWYGGENESENSESERIEAAMSRAKVFAKSQYESVKKYVEGLGVSKPIHIGETGWATISNGFFGAEGTKACDEYKSALYYKLTREWTAEAGISCFYFEAFDEKWKDSINPLGSENHFGLFNLDGEAKYALWDLVDEGVFDGLSRDGNPVRKSFNGEFETLMETVHTTPLKPTEISNVN